MEQTETLTYVSIAVVAPNLLSIEGRLKQLLTKNCLGNMVL